MATIQGLTIEIGANTTKFSTEMNKIQKEASTISKDLKTVNENLKLDPSNVEKSTEKLKLLQEAANTAAKKVDTINAAIEALNKSYTDKSSQEYIDQLAQLQRQLESATREQELANEKVDDFSISMGDAGTGVLSLTDLIKGNLISSAITGGLSILVDLLKSAAQMAVEAVKSVASFVGESIDLAKEMEETKSKVQAVFGEEGQKQIEDWASNAAHDFHTTKQAAMEYASSFGNILQNMGATTEESMKLSEQLVLVAAAQADFNNLPTTEVLDKITSALAGNYKGLQSLGIVLKEDDIIQRALNDTQKESADQLTDLEKKQAALEIVIEKSSTAVEKYGENTGSLTSMQGELEAKLQDIKTEIGQKLYPIAEDLFNKIIDFTNTEEFSTLLDTIYDSVEDIANSVLEFVNSGQMESWIQWLTDNLPTLGDKISEVAGKIVDIIDGIWNFIEAIKNWKQSVVDWAEDTGWFSNLPQAPSYAAGGAVSAGRMYKVNDDAGHRTEYFIPSTNGYILNGNDTQRVINNSNNSRTYGDLVVNVNSYGADAASIAEEIGAAVNRKLRVAGTW